MNVAHNQPNKKENIKIYPAVMLEVVCILWYWKHNRITIHVEVHTKIKYLRLYEVI